MMSASKHLNLIRTTTYEGTPVTAEWDHGVPGIVYAVRIAAGDPFPVEMALPLVGSEPELARRTHMLRAVCTHVQHQRDRAAA